jgi:hypothetical protein
MAKKTRNTPKASQTGAHLSGADAPRAGLTEEEAYRVSGVIHTCQRVLHGLTGVMIGAFVLIVLFTSLSTGTFVQVTGRALYFLILASAVTSLGTWIVRIRMEKRLGNETRVMADMLRPV